jgi:hypothetical protein
VRTKVTLVLVFLNVALFFFIFKFERNWRTEAASLEARRRVLGAEAADIARIEVANSAGNSFTLERRPERKQWMLVKPLGWPANELAVSTIVHELQLLEHETSFATKDLAKSGQSLADYGLEKPKLVVAFAGENGPRTELKIGDTTSVGNRLYILSPKGDRVHVVNRSLVDSLTQPVERLRADTLLTIPVFEAKQITLQTGSPDQVRSAAGGLRIRIRREGARWSFDAPIVARASKLAIDTTIADLNALHVKSFVASPPTPAPASAPTLRVTLEGNNRNETLFLGELVRTTPAAGAAATPPPAAGPEGAPTPDAEYYAQLEGRAPVFTVVVPGRVVDTLRNALVKLRERRLLDFEPRAVTAITLAAPLAGQPPLTLQRLEPAPNAATPDGAWQIIRRGDGAQPGTQTEAADPALIQRLLAQLGSLSALGFVSEAPTADQLESWGFNRPEREVRLTFAAAAGAPNTDLVLRLGTDAQRLVYARVGPSNENSIYSVDPEILRELSVEPVAWRNRLVHELPATARISALKLTDLTKPEPPLVETAIDANGQPTKAGLNVDALQKLLTQLRKLYANRFVQPAFADNVAAAGDEPWRYRLEATIDLPGGVPGQANTLTFFFTKRLGGAQQFAGSREIDAIFAIEQPLLDALWPLTEGARDPGPPPETKK